jgi:hypothetical protein
VQEAQPTSPPPKHIPDFESLILMAGNDDARRIISNPCTYCVANLGINKYNNNNNNKNLITE